MTFRRKSDIFLFFMALGILSLCLALLHAFYGRKAAARQIEEKREMVRRLELTDLCLFTDARYTRHPSMADLNTPFQDYPMSFDHFPSGSLLTPPPHIRVGR
jgi:hypothetical protein